MSGKTLNCNRVIFILIRFLFLKSRFGSFSESKKLSV